MMSFEDVKSQRLIELGEMGFEELGSFLVYQSVGDENQRPRETCLVDDRWVKAFHLGLRK